MKNSAEADKLLSRVRTLSHSRNRKRLVLAAALLVWLGLLPGGFQPQPVRAEAAGIKSRIGYTAYLGWKRESWAPLVIQLEKGLKTGVEVVQVNDSLQLLNALKNQQIEFAYVSPFDYVRANKLFGAEALVVQLTLDGQPGYYSILITSKKSGLENLEQAKGKIFAFTNSDSTSGFKVPVYSLFKERNQPISALASKSVFAGSHFAVIAGVDKGDYAVGATNTDDFKKSCALLGRDPGRFNVIWKSAFFPESLFVARKELSPELKSAFSKALFEFNSNSAGLKTLGIGGFAPIKESDFKTIRELQNFAEQKGISN